MKKADKTKLSDTVSHYLQLKGLSASQEKQMESLKKVIIEIADKYPNEFVDGVLIIEGIGSLKQVQNAPKLVWKATGVGLNALENIGLADDLGSTYSVTAVNITKLRDAVAREDAWVIGKLAEYAVKVVQETRLDVKAAK